MTSKYRPSAATRSRAQANLALFGGLLAALVCFIVLRTVGHQPGIYGGYVFYGLIAFTALFSLFAVVGLLMRIRLAVESRPAKPAQLRSSNRPHQRPN